METTGCRLAVAALLLVAPAAEQAFGQEAELYVGYASADCVGAPHVFATDMATIRSEAAGGRLRGYGLASRATRDAWLARVEALARKRATPGRRASPRGAPVEVPTPLAKDATVRSCRAVVPGPQSHPPTSLLPAAPAAEQAFGQEAELYVGYASADCVGAPHLFATDMATIRSEAAGGRLRGYGLASRATRDAWLARVEALPRKRATPGRRASPRGAPVEAPTPLAKDATVRSCRAVVRGP